MAISVPIVLFVTLMVIGEFNTGSDLSNEQQPKNDNQTYDQDEYDNRNDLYYVVNFINDFDVDNNRNNKTVIENKYLQDDEDELLETDNFDQEDDEEEEEEDVLKDFDDDENHDDVVEDYDDDFEDEDDDNIYGGSRHDKDEDDDEDEDEDEDDKDDDEDEDEDDDEKDDDDDEDDDDDKDDDEEGDDDKVDEEDEDDDEEDPIDTEISDDENDTNDSPKRSGSGSGLDRMARLRKYVEILNSRKSTWKAGINNLLKKPWKIRKRIMASAVVDKDEGDNRSLPTVRHRISKKTRIPKSFDPRKKWPYCSKVINNIRNQKSCGSCWAESVAGAMSDRVCIRSRGRYKLWLSTVDFSCCKFCGGAKGICWGGNGRLAWKYVQRVGLVTGGDRSNVGCKPFTMKAATSKCVSRCTNRHYKRSYKKDRFRTSRTYHFSKNVKQIQLELMTNGPMETAISVQPQFAAYHRGVYKPKRKGKFIGWHSVRLVGWGSQKGEPYWLLANSWGNKWGERGFFKISRKKNPAKVITMVTTGKPKVRPKRK